ncbi:MAG: chemotaxis response regulator protein-glutamate methylesterase [Dehalococcoidia bacterium]|nr:chemotaxis response regulator protein-glutamate methylesterase [Dehalococcoidia bacterium]
MKASSEKIRVLIVDDSAFARLVIAKNLGSDTDIEILGTAKDGIDAIDKIKALKPDVVTLDVEMPKMDGITTMERIMEECPVPVVMLSALTAEGADVTIKALEVGALDFFLKPSLINPTGSEEMNSELIRKIKTASTVDVSSFHSRVRNILSSIQQRTSKKSSTRSPGRTKLQNIVIIGSSTGGPRALYEVVPNIPQDIPAAVLIVKHMPPKFTKSIAERLNELSEIPVKEADAGDILVSGQAYIAPGGFHMVVKNNGQIGLNQERPRNGVRPAIDVTMEAAVQVYGSRCIGVILTGMGCDGTQGSAMIKAGGGKIIAEDESTCVIYGMPRSVAEAGLADKILPLPAIVNEIMAMCEKPANSLTRVSR